MSDILVNVENLNSYYVEHRGFARRKVRKDILKNVSFQLREGEILGLVGESGGGKSTLAKILCGMLRTYSGTVEIQGGLPQMVFQDPFSSLNPARTVGWILEEPLRIQSRLKAAERKKKVTELLQQVGLGPEYAKRKPWELSGGQRQRVCIAAAIIGGSKLIIADEPVSALDVTTQAQILQLFLQLRKQYNLTLIFITHDLNLVYQICDRAMVLCHGEIVEQNTVDALFSDPKHPYTKALLNE